MTSADETHVDSTGVADPGRSARPPVTSEAGLGDEVLGQDGAHAQDAWGWWTAPDQSSDVVPSARGAQRRLRALAAISWSPQAIEQETGLSALLVSSVLESHRNLSPDLAETIAAAYDRLWDCDPPVATSNQLQAAETARSLAARKGWAPPLAWDDDQLDIPEGRPSLGWRRRNRTSRRAIDLVEDAEFVRERGGYHDAGIAQVAMRLGVSRDRLEHAYARARSYAARSATAEGQVEAEVG
jgi:transcriptional regulator with XRE-family HTH domain